MQRAEMKTTRTNVEPTYPAPRCARAVVARRPPAARTLQHAPTLDCRLPSFIYEFVRQSHGVSLYIVAAPSAAPPQLALPPARGRPLPASPHSPTPTQLCPDICFCRARQNVLHVGVGRSASSSNACRRPPLAGLWELGQTVAIDSVSVTHKNDGLQRCSQD